MLMKIIIPLRICPWRIWRANWAIFSPCRCCIRWFQISQSMLLTWQGSIWVHTVPFNLLVTSTSNRSKIDTERALLLTFESNWVTRTSTRRKTCQVKSLKTLGTKCQNTKPLKHKLIRSRKKKIECSRKKNWWTLLNNRFKSKEGKSSKFKRKLKMSTSESWQSLKKKWIKWKTKRFNSRPKLLKRRTKEIDYLLMLKLKRQWPLNKQERKSLKKYRFSRKQSRKRKTVKYRNVKLKWKPQRRWSLKTKLESSLK